MVAPLALVQFPVGEEAWPSPELSRIGTEEFSAPPSPARTSRRVKVLSLIGDLMDHSLLSEHQTGLLIDLVLRGDREVSGISDLLDSRKTSNGKAQFLKIFLNVASPIQFGITTPGLAQAYHSSPLPPTPFVEFPSSLIRSASPPLRFPTAQRPSAPPPAVSSSPEDPKLSPESLKSTTVGTSVDEEVSPEHAQSGSICSKNACPDERIDPSTPDQ